MAKANIALEMLFGIGFKIGLLVAMLSVFMMVLPLLQMYAHAILTDIGLIFLIQQNPTWMNALFSGLLLMCAAFLISVIHGWLEPFIELLFYEDKRLEAKKL